MEAAAHISKVKRSRNSLWNMEGREKEALDRVGVVPFEIVLTEFKEEMKVRNSCDNFSPMDTIL